MRPKRISPLFSVSSVVKLFGSYQARFLAGWVERLRTRFLGAVVPAAPSQPTVRAMLTARTGWLNGLLAS
jgi:hypothetical protein